MLFAFKISYYSGDDVLRHLKFTRDFASMEEAASYGCDIRDLGMLIDRQSQTSTAAGPARSWPMSDQNPVIFTPDDPATDGGGVVIVDAVHVEITPIVV